MDCRPTLPTEFQSDPEHEAWHSARATWTDFTAMLKVVHWLVVVNAMIEEGRRWGQEHALHKDAWMRKGGG